MASKRKINLQILNEMMTILSEESSDYMKNLERFINKKINETREVNPNAKAGQLFAITLLNLANELYQLSENEDKRIEVLLEEEREKLFLEKTELKKDYEKMKNLSKKTEIDKKVLKDENKLLQDEIKELKNRINHNRQVLNNKDQEMVHLQNLSKEFERENERLRKELSYYEL